MDKRFAYTASHLSFLRTGYIQMSVGDLTDAFNKKFNLDKSRATIKSTMTSHGIKCGRSTGALKKGVPQVFTVEQKQWFIDNYPKFTRNALTEEFNQLFNETRNVSQVTGFLKRNKIKSGQSRQFKKGFKSWNKGTKGVCKANVGSFKKGRVPHNWVPVGSERIVEGGYLEVKTAEPHEWTPKQRLIFSAEHGPIPAGNLVRFKDGDTTNIELANLFSVNHAEHQCLNNIGFKHYSHEAKDTLILIAKVQTKGNAVLRGIT